MDAAVRDEPHQVNARPSVEGTAQHRILEERAVLDRLVHAHQVLVEPAPGADRQVADLAVSHLTGWQAGRLPRRLDRRMRVITPEAVEDPRPGEGHPIPRAARRHAPPPRDAEGDAREAF